MKVSALFILDKLSEYKEELGCLKYVLRRAKFYQAEEDFFVCLNDEKMLCDSLSREHPSEFADKLYDKLDTNLEVRAYVRLSDKTSNSVCFDICSIDGVDFSRLDLEEHVGVSLILGGVGILSSLSELPHNMLFTRDIITLFTS